MGPSVFGGAIHNSNDEGFGRIVVELGFFLGQDRRDMDGFEQIDAVIVPVVYEHFPDFGKYPGVPAGCHEIEGVSHLHQSNM